MREGYSGSITRSYVGVPAAAGARRMVHYRVAGSGPNIVLLHDSPRSSRLHVPLMKMLASRFRVFALDTPGYGNSDPLDIATPTIPDFAEALGTALDALGLSGAPIYATHTSAKIALALADRGTEQQQDMRQSEDPKRPVCPGQARLSREIDAARRIGRRNGARRACKQAHSQNSGQQDDRTHCQCHCEVPGTIGANARQHPGWQRRSEQCPHSIAIGAPRHQPRPLMRIGRALDHHRKTRNGQQREARGVERERQRHDDMGQQNRPQVWHAEQQRQPHGHGEAPGQQKGYPPAPARPRVVAPGPHCRIQKAVIDLHAREDQPGGARSHAQIVGQVAQSHDRHDVLAGGMGDGHEERTCTDRPAPRRLVDQAAGFAHNGAPRCLG